MNWSKYGIDLKGKSSGTIKVLCPKCSHTRKNKNDPCLSVDIDRGLFNCHNCSWHGNANEFVREKKVYTIPQLNNTQLSDKTLEWFQNVRKISKSTLLRFGVTENMEWMPQEGKEVKCINFNYKKDDVVVNVKFRDAKKNFKLCKNAELVFYNLDSIKESKTATICDGEIDCLSFYEAGIYDCVSVPNGASKGSMKLEYLDNCWEYFEGKEKIVIATDTDEAGMLLRTELARRLGKARCFYIDFKHSGTFKDSNEVLVAKGKEELVWLKENAIPFPLEGTISLHSIDDEINHIYNYGYKSGDKVGYDEFDDLISFATGQVTGVTGIPNSGKSEFIDQIIVKLSENHGWIWGVFSAENLPVTTHFAKFAEKYTGNTFYHTNPAFKMSVTELMESKEFVSNHMVFMDVLVSDLTLDYVLEKIEELVLRKGINGFLLDPWNYIEHDIPNGMSETTYINKALTKICKLAKRLDIHLIIVAHPVKMKKTKEGIYEVPTMYDISGSAHWFNKLDNGIVVYLNYDTGVTDVYVQKVRFKYIGKKGMSRFTWDFKNGRYTRLID